MRIGLLLSIIGDHSQFDQLLRYRVFSVDIIQNNIFSSNNIVEYILLYIIVKQIVVYIIFVNTKDKYNIYHASCRYY
jgi:hypothetical protein